MKRFSTEAKPAERNEEMDDLTAPHFGLPQDLWIPIAAISVEAIDQYVGQVVQKITGRKGRVNAVLVRPYKRLEVKDSRVRLWQDPLAGFYEKRLYPDQQVWVHVDYSGYRRAYQSFGMPEIPPEHFLDHIQNREAIRLRGYSHPYLRLCPVHSSVNTSGGVDQGGEGMEKDYLKAVKTFPAEAQGEFRRVLQHPIVYADPMDLTKMLNIPPGLDTLPGVAKTQSLFYPE